VYSGSSGDRSVALCLAVPEPGKPTNYLLAALHGQRLVTTCIPVAYRGEYHVSVRELGGVTLAGAASPGPDSGHQTTFGLDPSFRVDVWPLRSSTGSLTVFFTNVFFAVLISVILGVALNQRRKAETRAEERRIAAEAL